MRKFFDGAIDAIKTAYRRHTSPRSASSLFSVGLLGLLGMGSTNAQDLAYARPTPSEPVPAASSDSDSPDDDSSGAGAAYWHKGNGRRGVAAQARVQLSKKVSLELFGAGPVHSDVDDYMDPETSTSYAAFRAGGAKGVAGHFGDLMGAGGSYVAEEEVGGEVVQVMGGFGVSAGAARDMEDLLVSLGVGLKGGVKISLSNYLEVFGKAYGWGIAMTPWESTQQGGWSNRNGIYSMALSETQYGLHFGARGTLWRRRNSEFTFALDGHLDSVDFGALRQMPTLADDRVKRSLNDIEELDPWKFRRTLRLTVSFLRSGSRRGRDYGLDLQAQWVKGSRTLDPDFREGLTISVKPMLSWKINDKWGVKWSAVGSLHPNKGFFSGQPAWSGGTDFRIGNDNATVVLSYRANSELGPYGAQREGHSVSLSLNLGELLSPRRVHEVGSDLSLLEEMADEPAPLHHRPRHNTRPSFGKGLPSEASVRGKYARATKDGKVTQSEVEEVKNQVLPQVPYLLEALDVKLSAKEQKSLEGLIKENPSLDRLVQRVKTDPNLRSIAHNPRWKELYDTYKRGGSAAVAKHVVKHNNWVVDLGHKGAHVRALSKNQSRYAAIGRVNPPVKKTIWGHTRRQRDQRGDKVEKAKFSLDKKASALRVMIVDGQIYVARHRRIKKLHEVTGAELIKEFVKN